MKAFPILFIAIFLSFSTFGQEPNANSSLPYFNIPDYPEKYTAGAVAARMVDGLGFRFYWATEGLRPEDLSFRPSEGARNLEETVDHVYSLVSIIRTTSEGKVFAGVDLKGLSFEEKRKDILENLLAASTILQQKGDLTEGDKMVFQMGGASQEYPFWNLLNGPIADAINHTGQIITFRRTAGNPINPKISVLTGSVRE